MVAASSSQGAPIRAPRQGSDPRRRTGENSPELAGVAAPELDQAVLWRGGREELPIRAPGQDRRHARLPFLGIVPRSLQCQGVTETSGARLPEGDEPVVVGGCEGAPV